MTLSELVYRLFWHNSSVLEVTYYAQNNASIMRKSLLMTKSINEMGSTFAQYKVYFSASIVLDLQLHCPLPRVTLKIKANQNKLVSFPNLCLHGIQNLDSLGMSSTLAL